MLAADYFTNCPPTFPLRALCVILDGKRGALTGDFGRHGQDGQLAVYGDKWEFIDVPVGIDVFVKREQMRYRKTLDGWTQV